MLNNAHTFSGAHGTPDAAKIQTQGFRIPATTTDTSMFGRGLYFYKNDASGRKFAKRWGDLRALGNGVSPEMVRILCVSLVYSDNRFFRWGVEEEQQVFTLLKQWAGDKPERRLTREVQNKLRERYLTQLISRMPEGCALVLADLPLPPQSSEREIKRYPGCVVLDESILPPPPYAEEV